MRNVLTKTVAWDGIFGRFSPFLFEKNISKFFEFELLLAKLGREMEIGAFSYSAKWA